MPYESVQSLPDQIKNSLPESGQSEFLSILNSIAKANQNIKEEDLFQRTWGIMSNNGWTKEADKWVKKTSNSEDQLYFDVDDKEVFAAGKQKGDDYTIDDLDCMVKAFNELNGYRDVPLKLGHDDKQDILQKDGYPAAGWVKDLKRVGTKLVASFTGVPKRIKELIESKAYRKVSSEIIWNWADDALGKSYKRVLSAIALLGADLPAVGGLNDFGKFYDLNTKALNNIKYYTVEVEGKSPENSKQEELDKMSEEKVKELEAKLSAIEAEKKEFSEKLAKSEQEKKSLESEKVEREAKQKESEIRLFCEGLVKEEKMLPAEVDGQVALLLSADNVKKIKFGEKELSQLEILKQGLSGRVKLSISKAVSEEGKVDKKVTLTEDIKNEYKRQYTIAGNQFCDSGCKEVADTDIELDMKAKEYAKENKISYSEALIKVGR